jgi:two-component system, OmpR family, alkaline phosphatase synthesis response regulator PhoP
MSHEQILIVEDEENIQELLQYNLSKEGFRTISALSGEDALKKAGNLPIDLIVLDIMLPGMDGLDVCRDLRKNEKTSHIPIIMLTAKAGETDVVTGLELGADDYIAKPFSPKILVARIKNLLRRKSAITVSDDQPLHIHGLEIHPGRREVLYLKQPVDLTNMEFRILHFLAGKPGWVFSRYQIMEGVRGENYPVTDRAVDVMIVGLRKKLGNAGVFIETVRGVGYRFKEQQ